MVLIELNPARNAGLYASCLSAWLGAVRDWVATAATLDFVHTEGEK